MLLARRISMPLYVVGHSDSLGPQEHLHVVIRLILDRRQLSHWWQYQ